MVFFLLRLVETIISGLLIVLSGMILFEEREIKSKFKLVLGVSIYGTTFLIKIYNYNHIFSIGLSLFSILFLFKTLFNKKLSNIIIGTLLVITTSIIIDTSFIFLLNFFYQIDYNTFYHYWWIFSILNCIITTIFIYLCRGLFAKIVKRFNIDCCKSSRSVLFINIIMVSIFVISYYKLSWSLLSFCPFIILIYLFTISVQFILERIDLNLYLKGYDDIINYSLFMENLMSHYSVEFTNNDYSFIEELKVIKLPGIRTFMCYKIGEMRKQGAEVDLFISTTLNEIGKCNFGEQDLKTLYILLGLFCDIAMESVLINNEKTITFQVYYQEGEVIMVVANNCETSSKEKRVTGNINKSISKLAFDIMKIKIKNDNIFKIENNVVEGFLVQKLTIRHH